MAALRFAFQAIRRIRITRECAAPRPGLGACYQARLHGILMDVINRPPWEPPHLCGGARPLGRAKLTLQRVPGFSRGAVSPSAPDARQNVACRNKEPSRRATERSPWREPRVNPAPFGPPAREAGARTSFRILQRRRRDRTSPGTQRTGVLGNPPSQNQYAGNLQGNHVDDSL